MHIKINDKYKQLGETMEESNEKKDYILPQKVLAAEGVKGVGYLLQFNTDIASFVCKNPCAISPHGYVLLDFGKEYQGGVKIIAQDMMGHKNAKLRVRFGESAMEACSEIGYKGSTNDHSARDGILDVPWVGSAEWGNTGYRFIRIDNEDTVDVTLAQVLGVYIHSGKKMRGAFKCNDELINRVWEASARTLYLNNNRYIYDGIKRDRLVWIGDMHPETIGILRLFGEDESINRSLDYIRGITDLPAWMNDIPAYSMWWLKIHRDLYRYTGNKEYLKEQVPYVKDLVLFIAGCIDKNGGNNVEFKFIDWASSTDAAAQDFGIHALLNVALRSGKEILNLCGVFSLDEQIDCALKNLQKRKLARVQNKQACALGVFAGTLEAAEAEREVFSKNGLEGLSTFLSYYVLVGRVKAGNMNGALDIIRNYYGAMLKLGATTMWEDFDIKWVAGAKPIDSVLSPEEYDVHGDNGGYCYKGYRHSLCHGWAAGTVPFASEHILGVKVSDGGEKVSVCPELGDLEWAEGKFPTKKGDIILRCEKKCGKINVEYQAPQGIEVICGANLEQ